MIFNNSVTLYHASGDGFEKKFFVRASVKAEEKLEAKTGSRTANTGLNIRIFTDTKITVSPGDRLMIGYAEDALPPRDSHVIMSVIPNLTGTRSIRHYRIYAV